MSMVGTNAFAYACEVDGIYYRLDQEKKTASVTNKNGYQEESYSGHLVIPAEITYEGITYSVTEIGDVAFGGSKNLTGLTIGRNINHIYTIDLFAYASGLTNIIVDSENQTFDSRDNCNAVIETKTNTLVLGSKNTVIPKSVTAIGAGAFHGCKVLTSITIPNSITSIGSSALGGCTGLTRITIPNSVTAIGRSAFSGCTGLTNMIIPNSVTYIGERVFMDCSGLKSVNIGKGVTLISESLFSRCTSLSNITIPNSVTSIGSNAFYGCTGLMNITIPNSVTSIDGYAFQGCTGLTNITIPNSVTSIGSSPFYGCTNLEKITVESSNPVYDSRDNCNAIIKTADNELVCGCRNTVIPNNVTSIGSDAFYGCSGLANVTIPNNITTIGDCAFRNCSSLKLIVCDNPVPPTAGYSSFPYDGAVAIVPESAVSAYKAATGWSRLSFNSVTFGYTSTQTTIKLFTSNIFTDQYAKMGDTEYHPVNDTITITNLKPDTQYYIETFCKYGSTELNNYLYVKTKPVTLSTGSSTTNLTATIWGSYDAGDMEVKEHGFEGYSAEDITQDEEGRDVLSLKDLKPGTSMTFTYYVILSDGTKLTKNQTAYTKSVTLSVGYTSTNVTLHVWGKHEVDDAVVTDYGFNYHGRVQEVTYNDCKPGNTYTFTYYVEIADGTRYTREIKATTKPIYLYLTASDVTTTTVQLTGSYDVIDATVLEYGFNNYPNETEVHLTGLDPGTEYRSTFYVNTKEGGKVTKEVSFTTNPLILKTLQPRVISSGNVIVAAESNIDDGETNVGFEWRRTDWTSDFESNKGGAYLFDGMMEGYIRNLNADKLWKYRPYYTSNSGKSYYGDWVGIDPTNTSYFEPTVHTYAKISVEGNAAEVKGYVMRGSDNVVQQGFKYWKASTATTREGEKHAPSIPKDAMTVEAEGTVMTAELTDLEYETEYCIVAFVKTSENETFYGEQQTFQTGIDTSGVEEVMTAPGEAKEVARYDLKGRRLDAPRKGLNILRMSDGTVRKVMVRSAKK